MKCKIALYKPVQTVNDYGEAQNNYQRVREIYAERVKVYGRRSEEAGEHFPDYSVSWNIRDAHHVRENWRVSDDLGYVYTVTNIIPNRDRGMLTLVCERVNE